MDTQGRDPLEATRRGHSPPAIHSCHIAAGLDPWLLVTEGGLNGILANHRANMAAHISHTRFYVNLLVETLST